MEIISNFIFLYLFQMDAEYFYIYRLLHLTCSPLYGEHTLSAKIIRHELLFIESNSFICSQEVKQKLSMVFFK